jgi:hypothetical protein
VSDNYLKCEGSHDFTDPVVVKLKRRSGWWLVGYESGTWEMSVYHCRRCGYRDYNGFRPSDVEEAE